MTCHPIKTILLVPASFFRSFNRGPRCTFWCECVSGFVFTEPGVQKHGENDSDDRYGSAALNTDDRSSATCVRSMAAKLNGQGVNEAATGRQLVEASIPTADAGLRFMVMRDFPEAFGLA